MKAYEEVADVCFNKITVNPLNLALINLENTASECWNLKNIFDGTRSDTKTRFEALATLDSKRVR